MKNKMHKILEIVLIIILFSILALGIGGGISYELGINKAFTVCIIENDDMQYKLDNSPVYTFQYPTRNGDCSNSQRAYYIPYIKQIN